MASNENLDLFEPAQSKRELAPGVVWLRGWVDTTPLLLAIAAIAESAPFRHMVTRGGKSMSAALTNTGPLGWYSDRSGYRYTETDPESGRPWPGMPDAFAELARSTAAEAGFGGFEPDACLINRYGIGARMGAHRDYDEHDLGQPIVSVSIGLPATYRLGGLERGGPSLPVDLRDGDIVVLGGPGRLRYHSVSPIRPGEHPRTGHYRYNLTFRRAR